MGWTLDKDGTVPLVAYVLIIVPCLLVFFDMALTAFDPGAGPLTARARALLQVYILGAMMLAGAACGAVIGKHF